MAKIAVYDMNKKKVSDLEDLGRLRTFMESTNFNVMSPHDELAYANTAYVLADPASMSYIAYGLGGVTALGLTSLVAGTYDLSWFDPVSGSTIEQTSVNIQDGTNSFSKPAGIGDEAALYISIASFTSGDINGDGKVDVADVLLATRIALGLLTPTPEQLLRGDIAPVTAGIPAPDGEIGVPDLIVIQRIALGL